MRDRPVHYERQGSVARITLNRPTSRNAIDDSLATEFREACRSIVEDDEAYVALITGAGPAFCSGSAPLEAADAQALARRRVSEALAAIPKPVIAAIQGEALGQGLELALACDIRIAAQDARFAMDQVAYGWIPWDGGTQRLPRLLPRGLALDMILTGRPLDALGALDYGLVSEVVAPEALPGRGLELAERIASLAPIACSYAKEAALKGMEMTLEQGVRLEADLAVLLHTTKDRAEGIGAFLSKRQARFTGH